MNSVTRITRNRLRADQSMMAFNISVSPVPALGRFCRRCTAIRLLLTAHSTQCRLEIALRIDQEIGGCHHLLAFCNPFQHFDIIFAAAAQLDGARLEVSPCQLYPVSYTHLTLPTILRV